MKDVVPEGRAAFKHFKNTGEIEFPADMSSHEFDVWACVFEDDLNGWKLVRYEQMKRMIEQLHAEFMTCESIIRMVALTAVVCTKQYHPFELEGDTRLKATKLQALFKEMYPVMENMWLSSFKDEPLFIESYTENKRIFGY